MKDLIQIFDKFRVEKKNLHVCIMNQVSLRDREYCVQKQLRSNALKRNELKVYISLNSNKLACFWNSQGSFQVHDLVDDFWKKCPRGARFFAVEQTCTKSLKQGIQKNCITKFSILSALKLPSCGVVVFIDMNTFLYLQKTEHFFVYYLLKKCWLWNWT